MDSESRSGSGSDVVNQVVSLYPDSVIFVSFETIYYHKIDPDSWWNLIGIFPKFIFTSELSITHSEIMDRGSYDMAVNDQFLGSINISPTSFKKRTVTEKRDVTIVSALGVMGGVVGILLSIQACLFGTRPKEPWGVFQKSKMRAHIMEERHQSLNDYFRVPKLKTVPFMTPVHPRYSKIHNYSEENIYSDLNSNDLENSRLVQDNCSENTQLVNDSALSGYVKDDTLPITLENVEERLADLEGRNQVLELILRAYYIDDTIFREFHDATTSKPLATVESLEPVDPDVTT